MLYPQKTPEDTPMTRKPYQTVPVKIHDLVLEGIDAALRRRGYPSVESLKAGKKQASFPGEAAAAHPIGSRA